MAHSCEYGLTERHSFEGRIHRYGPYTVTVFIHDSLCRYIMSIVVG